MASTLRSKRCKPCEGSVAALTTDEAGKLLSQVGGHWTLAADGRSIQAQFPFRNYYQTTAFVNAVAWIAHREDHHPDISFGYKSASVTYSTHAANGLTENDFICAAKVDALIES